MKREAAKNLCGFLIIVFVASLIFQFIRICKQNFTEPENLTKKEDIFLALGNQDKKFSIEIYAEGLTRNAYFIGKTLFSKNKLKLSGFERDIKIYSQGTENIGERYFVCLYGDVGVHSQNIEIVAIEKDRLKPVKIKSKEDNSENIVSDYPGFSFKKEEDNLILTVDQRDYDKDPTLFSKREKYIYNGELFIFDSEVEIPYDE